MKNLINILLTTGVILAALFLIDDNFGVALLFIWLLGLCLSFILPLLYLKRIHIQLKSSKCHIEKDDTLTLTLILHNTTYLPTPLLTLHLSDSPYMKLDAKSKLSLCLAARETRSIELKFSAIARGVTSLGLDHATLHHFLGIKSYPLLRDYTAYKKDITILPKLYTLDSSNAFVKDVPRQNEDEESSSTPTLQTTQSFELDFSCRPYTAGDALSKIHWKHSAKSGTLMVRRHLETSLGRSKVILDFLSASYLSPKAQALCEGDLIEGFLSLGLALYRSGVEVDLCYFENNGWCTYKIETLQSFWQLQNHFATYSFLPSSASLSERLNSLLLANGAPEKEHYVTVFTHAPEKHIISAKAAYQAQHLILHTLDPIDFKEVV